MSADYAAYITRQAHRNAIHVFKIVLWYISYAACAHTERHRTA